jgi:membrane-associated phospholipid phosphatase
LTFLIFGTLIPGFYVLWLMETEKIRDIHMADLNERKVPFLITGISSVIGALLLMYLHAARPVIVIAVAYATNALAVALITQYWKISIHMAMLSSIITVTVIIFGPVWAWAYFLLILLGWSRVHRKKHTVLQVTAGAALAFLLTAMVFGIYGYL